MSYRRYPDRERALSQLDRHHHPAPPLSEVQQQMAESARQVLEPAERQLRPFVDAMRLWATAAAANVQRETSLTSQLGKMLRERSAAF
ncbi:hypothetical protein [Streptomyces bobili]|uniref:hypothetical protein n=1 Tax=Streptomyces bobili TaxID=67280 RepID=UPI0037A47F7C